MHGDISYLPYVCTTFTPVLMVLIIIIINVIITFFLQVVTSQTKRKQVLKHVI